MIFGDFLINIAMSMLFKEPIKKLASLKLLDKASKVYRHR